jgi:hypothetical protein
MELTMKEECWIDLNVCEFRIVVLILLCNKGVGIPSNTTMFNLFYFFTSATCFGLLSGHHQAFRYAIQLYIFLLLMLMVIHYYCLYFSMVSEEPCMLVSESLLVRTCACCGSCFQFGAVSSWFLLCSVSQFGLGVALLVLFVGRTCVCTYPCISGVAFSDYACGLGAWVCGFLFYSRIVAFLVGLSFDVALLVALSLDVINPCYPRCAGTGVALCYYWCLCVSRY